MATFYVPTLAQCGSTARGTVRVNQAAAPGGGTTTTPPPTSGQLWPRGKK